MRIACIINYQQQFCRGIDNTKKYLEFSFIFAWQPMVFQGEKKIKKKKEKGE